MCMTCTLPRSWELLTWRQQHCEITCIVFCSQFTVLTVHVGSDWSSLSVYEPELVHDIIDSEEEEVYEDEDDSNGKSPMAALGLVQPASSSSLAFR